MRSNILKHSLAGLVLSTALCGTAWAEDVLRHAREARLTPFENRGE